MKTEEIRPDGFTGFIENWSVTIRKNQILKTIESEKSSDRSE
jgi:hypothetical protein